MFEERASKGWLSNRMAAWLSCRGLLLAEVINAIHNWDQGDSLTGEMVPSLQDCIANEKQNGRKVKNSTGIAV